MNENFFAVAEALEMNERQLADLAINGFKASWLAQDQIDHWTNKINNICDSYS